MKYYFDTEFLEGTQSKRFLGIKVGKTKPTIDLISIGIVCEDGREYYAISNEFNFIEAWNRHTLVMPEEFGDEPIKEYWIRENILKPIWCDLFKIHGRYSNNGDSEYAWEEMSDSEKYVYFKLLLAKYGKSNKQIADEIKLFIQNYKLGDVWEEGHRYNSAFGNGVNNTYYFVKDGVKSDVIVGTSKSNKPVFYGYYSAYDWVVFCWLFDKLMNLPTGFPWYCIDLKQELDRIEKEYNSNGSALIFNVKKLPNYPKQTDKHNALADAKWNKSFHKFLINIHG